MCDNELKGHCVQDGDAASNCVVPAPPDSLLAPEVSEGSPFEAAMERQGGYIKIHRRLASSPVWQSLTSEQSWVVVQLLMLANWKQSTVLHQGKWHTVERGELIHSQESIAASAKVSRKVVRTTIEKLMVDDTSVGGNGPFLKTRWTGQLPGQGLHVITICRYSEYQDAPVNAGQQLGQGGASLGPASGQGGAPSEEGIKKGKQLKHIKKAESDARKIPFTDAWRTEWANVHDGEKPDCGAHLDKVASFLKAHPEVTLEEWTKRAKFSMNTSDRWFRQNGHLSMFCSKWANWKEVSPDPTKGRVAAETQDHSYEGPADMSRFFAK